MLELVPALKHHFDGLRDRMLCFCKHGCQLEGWFKGELLALLDHGLSNGLIRAVDREVKVEKGKIDLVIDAATGERYWIELKHWLIGEQKGYSYNASFYFSDKSSVGITKDVDKLRELGTPGDGYMLILLTANPGIDDWGSGVSKFNTKFEPRHVESLTDPADYDESYFLGLLRTRALP